MAYRYNSYDSRSSTTSSILSDPSSSSEFKPSNPPSSSRIKPSNPSSSRPIVKSKPLKPDHPPNLTSMVKKLMDIKKSNPKTKILIPSHLLAEDLKRTARETGGAKNGFGALQRKLFGKTEKVKEVKALTEVKGNTRTLAMVLRSERELLNMNKEQEIQIAELKSQLEEKNREVEKLKDLCLKQREEIKSLKSAILFPDAMNSQLQDVLERQGSELKQARQIIPSLQKQVTSLTGQLQCLAEDLAEVKANKYSSGSCYQQSSNSLMQTSSYDRGESSDSLEFSSGDPETPGSPDGLALEDLNPCLTPYCKTKSEELERRGYESGEERYSGRSRVTRNMSSRTKKVSKSSECSHASEPSKLKGKPSRWSEERKGAYRKATSERVL